MSKSRQIQRSERVNHPYKNVRDALIENATAVFQGATQGAVSHTDLIAAELHANIGRLELAKEVAISVTNIDRNASAPKSPTATRMQLEWQATKLPRLFPLMKAELLIYPFSGTETQLDFVGIYEPPAGAFGGAIDSIVGHRIAKLSVQHFVTDIATYLRMAATRTSTTPKKSGNTWSFD